MKQLYVTNRDQWRDWLSEHYAAEVGVWLVFYKKATSKPTIQYEAAVEEALESKKKAEEYFEKLAASYRKHYLRLDCCCKEARNEDAANR